MSPVSTDPAQILFLRPHPVQLRSLEKTTHLVQVLLTQEGHSGDASADLRLEAAPPSEHLIKPGRLTGLSVKKHSRNPEGFEIISLFYQNTTEQNVGFVVVVLLIKPEVVWFKRHAELTRV